MATAKQTAYRNKMITLIHVARRDLGLDEGTYRTILKAQGGDAKLSAMKIDGIKKVLDYLKSQGFKLRKTKTDRKQANTIDARKARAIWLMLHELGAVKDPSEAALTAYVKRIDGVDDLAWMRDPTTVIETLKKWAMRYLPADVVQLRQAAIARHRAGLMSPAESEHAALAFKRADAGEGFDIQHEVWNNLRAAIGRPFPQ